MGEGIAPETREKIKLLVEKDPAVIRISNIISTYQSPEEVLLMIIVVFEPDIDTEDITDAISRIREHIRKEFKFIKFIIIQPSED